MHTRSKLDKDIEFLRYENRAKNILEKNSESRKLEGLENLDSIKHYYKAPYNCYHNKIHQHIKAENSILEIGSGTGLHTQSLLNTGAQVMATDISQAALNLLSARYIKSKNLKTQVADMEVLPFDNESFDAVVSAGSLSYGDSKTVFTEIKRVLKPGGYFICVDSLANNPIYRLNRWIHYLRGNRTLSTLDRIPRVENLVVYTSEFQLISMDYFGAISWLMPLLALFIGEQRAARVSDQVDRCFRIQRSAFKFVMVTKKEIN